MHHLEYKHINKSTLNAIREHWDMGFWNGGVELQQIIFESLIETLCKIYKIRSIPRLIVGHRFKCVYLSVQAKQIPIYRKIIGKHHDHAICLNKYSITSFLHEFKHMVDIWKTGKTSEKNALGWSLSCMYLVNPAYYVDLVNRGKIYDPEFLKLQKHLRKKFGITVNLNEK